MSSVANNGIDKGKLIKWIVTLVLSFSFFLVPTSETFTPESQKFLCFAVLTILIVAFELMNMMIPSILLPTAYVLFGVCNATQALKPFATHTTWMVLGAYALAIALDQCGLLKRIAYSVICKLGGSYNRTLYAMYIIGIILGQLTFCGHYMILIAFAYGVCQAMNLKPYSKEGVLMMCVGGMAALNVKLFIYRPATLNVMIASLQATYPDFYMYPLLQTWYNLPEVFMAFGYIWLATKVLKTKEINFEGGKAYFEAERAKLGKMGAKEYKASIILACVLIWILTEPWHGLSSNYPFLIFPWLCWMPGINIADDAALNKVKGFFGTFVFVGACLGIGQMAQFLGLGKLLAEALIPYLQNFGFVGVTYGVLILSAAANLLLTPGAMYSLLPAVLGPIYQVLGLDPTVALLTVIYATDVIFMPHEVTAYLVMFGFGMMRMKDFIFFYGGKSILTIVMFGLVQLPWWHFVCGLY